MIDATAHETPAIVPCTTDEALSLLARIHMAADIRFEAACFSLADDALEGYNGGQWTAARVNGEAIYVPPGGERVMLNCIGSGHAMIVDRITAGAAITLWALNAVLIGYYHQAPESAVVEALCDVFYRIRDAVLDKRAGLDTGAILRFID